MKSILVLISVAFSVAATDAKADIECVPLESNLVKKVVVSGDFAMRQMTIEYANGLMATAATEEDDDVDATFFYSESLNAQLEFHWAEMNEENRASGDLISNWEGTGARILTPVECVEL